jgi:hypothetical protein
MVPSRKSPADKFVADNEVDENRLRVLAGLTQHGRLEVRIAIAVDANGDPIIGGMQDFCVREKI